MKRPILKDVANKAQVSVGLASRILRNIGSFSEKTRSRVLRAARELDYQTNNVARSLKIKQTRAIGVVISDIASHFFTLLVRGVEDVASKSGYSVVLCNTDENPAKEQNYLTALYERNVDGLIICASPGNDGYIKKIARSGMPVVLVYRNIPGLHAPRITSDDQDSSSAAINYLIDLGHRDIALIRGISGVQSDEERLAGYKKALERRKIPVKGGLIVSGEYVTEKAYQVTQSLLKSRTPPTAILACSELMMIGALYAIRDEGKEIPRDVSIIGFGDPSWAGLMNPPLTVIRQPNYPMGLLAGESLINMCEGNELRDRLGEEVVLKSKFIPRNSCQEPKRSA